MAPTAVTNGLPRYEMPEAENALPSYEMQDSSAPPEFAAVAINPLDNLTNQTRNINLGSVDPHTPKPSREQVLAHLKFLHAVHQLRLSISAQDGLFNLNDSDIRDAKAAGHTDELRKLLSEKRWAVYVARAVERFTVWWNVLHGRIGTQAAKMADFEVPGRMESWVERGVPEGVIKTRDDLPPLDVLMVWHSFQLNPRAYLEDCVLKGMMRLWHNGMPWSAIDSCTDVATGYFNPGDHARQSWEASTGLSWVNTLDPAKIEIACRNCRLNGTGNMLRVPWTTFDVRKARLENGQLEVLGGTGYADSEFEVLCPTCQKKTTHAKLRATKFTMDIRERYFGDGRLLAGTILDIDGQLVSARGGNTNKTPFLYCNFMMKEVLRMRCKAAPLWHTIEDVRTDIEATIADEGARINASTNLRVERQAPLHRTERIMIRRMLSRYWENSSPFALDLVGAVIRQNGFIEKMERIDWLHSPAATSTADNLIIKYRRFMQMMADNMMQMMVPTLDIDLGWHTHQLSPPRYYTFSTNLKCNPPSHTSMSDWTKNFRPGFIDHDDKIEESKLSDAFIKTTELYQKEFKEPYSLCTCWYCESVRAQGSSLVSNAKAAVALKKTSIFRRKSATPVPAADPHAAAADAITESIEKQLYNPYKPVTNDPTMGPHISAHNSVRPVISDRNRTLVEWRLADQAKAVEKARKIAGKKGRTSGAPPALPLSVTKLDPLLKAYPYAQAPFMADRSVHSALYPTGPLHADYRYKGPGNCATGTCGGQVASGSCGAHSSHSACANGAAAGCGAAAGNIVENGFRSGAAGYAAGGMGAGGGGGA